MARATERLAGSENQSPTDQTDGRSTDDPDTYWARRADALVQVMADSLSGGAPGAPGDRHQVHVHVSAETLANGSTVPAETLAPAKTVPAETSAGARDVPAETPADLKTIPAETSAHARNVPAETLSGPKRVPAETLHPETIRRLACDGGLITLITRPQPATRSVSAARPARYRQSTRRALVSRDRHCQYPGCSQQNSTWKAITSCTGRTAVRPGLIIWCCCAAATIGRCMSLVIALSAGRTAHLPWKNRRVRKPLVPAGHARYR